MVKENVKVEEIFDEDVIVEEKGEETMKNKKINWKLLAKCTAGIVLVGAASVALYKWRKSKKVSTTAVVVATPSDNSGANETVAPTATVVEI